MKDLVNDLGKVTHSVIKAVSHFFSTHGREAQSHDKGKGNSRKSIHDRLQCDREKWCQGCVCGSCDLIQCTFTHKVREQAG